VPSFSVTEKTTAMYYATLKDESGAIIGPSVLQTLTLTLSDKATAGVINGRNAQNVLNANNVLVYDTLQTVPSAVKTYATTYNLAWAIQAADNAIVTDSSTVETHLAVFQAGWGGNKTLNFQVTLLVKNLAKVS
jgi:hypothetical protein